MTAMRIRLVANFGSPSSPLPSYVGLSILAHVTFVAALLLALGAWGVWISMPVAALVPVAVPAPAVAPA